MKFYEVVFETGEHSVLMCEDQEECMRFVKEHHRRAKAGERGGPAGNPAIRIAKIFEYDQHPSDLAAPDAVSSDEALSRINAALKAAQDENRVVRPTEFIAEIAHEFTALNPNARPHESKYRTTAKKAVKWPESGSED